MFLAAKTFARTDGVGALRNRATADGGYGSNSTNRIEHMSAGLPPITDIARRDWHGRKVPTAVIAAIRRTGVMECPPVRIIPA